MAGRTLDVGTEALVEFAVGEVLAALVDSTDMEPAPRRGPGGWYQLSQDMRHWSEQAVLATNERCVAACTAPGHSRDCPRHGRNWQVLTMAATLRQGVAAHSGGMDGAAHTWLGVFLREARDAMEPSPVRLQLDLVLGGVAVATATAAAEVAVGR